MSVWLLQMMIFYQLAIGNFSLAVARLLGKGCNGSSYITTILCNHYLLIINDCFSCRIKPIRRTTSNHLNYAYELDPNCLVS